MVKILAQPMKSHDMCSDERCKFQSAGVAMTVIETFWDGDTRTRKFSLCNEHALSLARDILVVVANRGKESDESSI